MKELNKQVKPISIAFGRTETRLFPLHMKIEILSKQQVAIGDYNRRADFGGALTTNDDAFMAKP